MILKKGRHFSCYSGWHPLQARFTLKSGRTSKST